MNINAIKADALREANFPNAKETYYFFLAAVVNALFPLSAGDYGLALASVVSPLLLYINRKWASQILEVILISFGIYIVGESLRLFGAPGKSLYELISSQFSLAAIFALNIYLIAIIHRRQSEEKDNSEATVSLSLISFSVTFVLLFMMRIKAVSIQLLIVDRFFPQIGNFEVFLLSVYAAWMTDNLLNEKESAKWRKRLWLLFSVIFFIQFLLGISGFEKFMQTGKLHLPIPALVVGGPVYRGSGIFMAILLSVTLIFAGPSWCSHLCYVGAIDQYFAKRRKHSRQIPLKWRQRLRFAILILTVAIAFTLNYFNVSPLIAGGIAVLFAVVSLITMIIYSSKTGVLVHCTSVCPIGWITTTFGRINPFRIRLNDNCTDCQICSLHCNYGALNREDITNRKPNSACTLCGDCVGACPHDAIDFRFAKMNPYTARRFFIVLIVILHTFFIAVARV